MKYFYISGKKHGVVFRHSTRNVSKIGEKYLLYYMQDARKKDNNIILYFIYPC